jgi:hypothetical protein
VAGIIVAVLDNDGSIRRQWECVHNGLVIGEAVAVAVLADQSRGR